MISSKRSLLVAAAMSIFASSSYAAIITPGGAIAATPVAVDPSAVQVDGNVLPFIAKDASSNVVFTGTEVTNVYANDTFNPLGGLTFTYLVLNNASSLDLIDRVTLSGYAGFLADAGYINGSGTFSPVVITRSGNGDVIGFDFSSIGFPNNDIAPGSNSTILVIRTNALNDTPDTMSLEDGGNGTIASLAPAAGSGRTPEPASLATLALGGLALAARRRK